MKFLTLLLLANVAFSAELPSSAAAAMADFDKDIVKLTADFDKAKAKRTDELSKALNKSLVDATKKGDLDGAMAIKDALAKLAPEAKDAVKPTPVVALTRQSVAGSYSIRTDSGWSGVFTLRASGEASQPGASGIFKVKDNTITISWNNGYVESFTMTSETEGAGADKDGVALHAKKMPGLTAQK